ncbi:MAG: CDP-glycerol glycerophosphotransferase family protein [Clostridia bacterium]|nr:CDP-glycerol glycerophosphotransferase family protein [Clostridia bacterium]
MLRNLLSLPKRLWEALLWELFRPLGVKKNKVVLQSYYGRGLSDSPGAIAEELLKRGGFELYWVVNGDAAKKTLPEGIKPVKYRSSAFVYHMSTSGFWIDNARKTVRKRKKPSQIYIQTWHGFALKRIEKDAEASLDAGYVRAAKADGAICDLMISDSAHMTSVYKNSFWFSGEILGIGLPRNDFLVRAGEKEKSEIKRSLGFGDGDRLALYAPTFRSDGSLDCYQLDYAALRRSLGARFGGEWTVLVKLHSNLEKYADSLRLSDEGVKNLSHYPDIQKLYVASDVLITDYSSVMFDFMLTSRPCFLFASDVEEYMKDRNFYFALEELPFELCRDVSSLCRAVEGFDEEAYLKRLGAFRERCGIVADGEASKKTVDWMEKKLNDER